MDPRHICVKLASPDMIETLWATYSQLSVRGLPGCFSDSLCQQRRQSSACVQGQGSEYLPIMTQSQTDQKGYWLVNWLDVSHAFVLESYGKCFQNTFFGSHSDSFEKNWGAISFIYFLFT